MKTLLLSLLLAWACIPTLFADNAEGEVYYQSGMEYFNAGEYKAALQELGKAAKEGNKDAQYQIALMFLDGKGVTKNEEDAAYWFRKAAQNGHAPSQFEIGYCFANGVGVAADQRIAAEWFWRAAENGDPDAAYYLACMYRDGKGMQQNIEKARKYFTIASNAGLPEAKEELNKLPAPKSKTNTSSRKPQQRRKGGK